MKFNDDELREIVRTKLSGWQMVEGSGPTADAGQRHREHDAGGVVLRETPDLDTLRDMYIGSGSADQAGSTEGRGESDAATSGSDEQDETTREDTLVLLRPDGDSGAADDPGPGPKAFVVGADGEPIGAQG